ncbi:ATPase domain-containing protein [Halorarius halobius]|uniref:ATPase domain-containing protein n=1 Tax=Halorarius halobius TaxID=2962671 RepID=UPI0020CF8D1D|nr:ATPase domain-containing protein [Halorarius halobius]
MSDEGDGNEGGVDGARRLPGAEAVAAASERDGEGVACAFCRLPVPETPVEATLDGQQRAFCSQACADAYERADAAFDEYHGNRRVEPGVSALDASLPEGYPRNAFVLVPGEAGTRDRAVGAELVWRTLQRGEPVVFVSFQEPPGAVVQQFLTLEWNVLPYLESGLFHIIDCFTYRLDDRDRMFDRMDDWNGHLYDVAEDATTTVRDPTDVGEVHNKLDNALEDRDMVDQGLVIVDSLTELGTLVQPVRAYNFVKDIRADICKGRFVPIFAGATISAGSADQFPHDLQYTIDGLIELRLNDEIVPNTLVKQVRIRKLNGALVVPEWHAYEYAPGTGMVTFDPEAELREKREEDGEPSAEANAADADDPETARADDGGPSAEDDGADPVRKEGAAADDPTAGPSDG